MSELNRMGCGQLADVAAELALGALTGRERAQALAHLDHCPVCREYVHPLTMIAEELLKLLPGIEPSPGFETRVMERTGLTAQNPRPVPGAPSRIRRLRRSAWKLIRAGPARRTRQIVAAAAVTLAAATAALGGWGLRAATQAPATSLLTSATLVSASSQPSGTIFVYYGTPGWLYVSVDLTLGNGIVVCQVVRTDGRVTAIGWFWLADGYGFWGSPASVDTGPLAGARLVSADGAVPATARFPRR